MQTRLFTFPLLALSLALPGATASAQPVYKSPYPTDFQVPPADLEKWANRLKKLCPSENWRASIAGNDVLLELYMPVAPIVKDTPRFVFLIRYRLRFGPLLSQDSYEALWEEN